MDIIGNELKESIKLLPSIGENSVWVLLWHGKVFRNKTEDLILRDIFFINIENGKTLLNSNENKIHKIEVTFETTIFLPLFTVFNLNGKVLSKDKQQTYVPLSEQRSILIRKDNEYLSKGFYSSINSTELPIIPNKLGFNHYEGACYYKAADYHDNIEILIPAQLINSTYYFKSTTLTTKIINHNDMSYGVIETNSVDRIGLMAFSSQKIDLNNLKKISKYYFINTEDKKVKKEKNPIKKLLNTFYYDILEEESSPSHIHGILPYQVDTILNLKGIFIGSKGNPEKKIFIATEITSDRIYCKDKNKIPKKYGVDHIEYIDIHDKRSIDVENPIYKESTRTVIEKSSKTPILFDRKPNSISTETTQLETEASEYFDDEEPGGNLLDKNFQENKYLSKTFKAMADKMTTNIKNQGHGHGTTKANVNKVLEIKGKILKKVNKKLNADLLFKSEILKINSETILSKVTIPIKSGSSKTKDIKLIAMEIIYLEKYYYYLIELRTGTRMFIIRYKKPELRIIKDKTNNSYTKIKEVLIKIHNDNIKIKDIREDQPFKDDELFKDDNEMEVLPLLNHKRKFETGSAEDTDEDDEKENEIIAISLFNRITTKISNDLLELRPKMVIGRQNHNNS